ncbi:hypothetical protein [Paraclostridium sordellii]|uniref:hypothetical protein n=1 Tax=Paraclostridium sordellii TaxID=1505 RepID=UPI0005E50507|nr:hypothetical protein [Paeniclostridium sordellii]CEO23081.1 membrane protein [[Clostridium] sordellii] [Paeniclostridium sordellii]
MKKNVFGNFIPIITMLVVIILGVGFNLKGVFIIGLVGIVPLSFLIEGVMCSRKKIGFIIPLITSLTAFFIVILIYMNDSANVYLKYCLIAYILGYLFEKMISTLKRGRLK